MAIENETCTDVEQFLAKARQAEAEYNAAARAVVEYTRQHPEESPIKFQFDSRVVFQTPRMSVLGIQLHRALAKAYEKRNRAWAARGEFLSKQAEVNHEQTSCAT